jgi:hypothetical protein
MYGYGYSLYNRLAFLGGLDSDATAFFSATGITDPTIQGAINSLCVDLKTYGVWDKMKAIYPFVGGTPTTHKFNLKDSRDLDVAFRLAFSGGITHDSNGFTPNGVNGFANTFLTPIANQSINSGHFSLYSKTSIASLTLVGSSGVRNASAGRGVQMCIRRSASNRFFAMNSEATNDVVIASNETDARGFYLGSRTAINSLKYYKNNNVIASTTGNQSETILSSNSYYLGGLNQDGFLLTASADNKQLAFATIGEGLTDEDSANLYYSVQKFQTTLGRQVGTPIYSSNATDVNARLFLGATNIQDATITNAVDTLVQGLKTDGIWSKLKAVYPFVGGTSTTHKFNLANALDEDSAFRLAFSGGWTHANTGATPNGTNGYANTFFNPSVNLTASSSHATFYSRTNFAPASPADKCFYGLLKTPNYFLADLYLSNYTTAYTHSGSVTYNALNTGSTGLIMVKNVAGTQKFLRNNVTIHTSTPAGAYPNDNVYLNALNNNGISVGNYSPYQCAFASFGDGLTDTEASNLYTRVQAFQTTLNRQV